jgi:hypothetical protein
MAFMKLAVTIVVALVVLALGLSLAWGVVAALRNGVAQAAGNRRYSRRKRPAMFWIAVLGQGFFSFVFIYGVVRCIERLTK